MVDLGFHVALMYLLGTDDSRAAAVLDRSLVRSWLAQFRGAVGGAAGGAVSREGLHLRVFMLLALELWLRDQKLAW